MESRTVLDSQEIGDVFDGAKKVGTANYRLRYVQYWRNDVIVETRRFADRVAYTWTDTIPRPRVVLTLIRPNGERFRFHLLPAGQRIGLMRCL
jgi:hypothetical protein